jgi:hypothetical protein
MTIHVLGHLGEVFRLAPRDWLRRTRRDVFLLLSHVDHWLAVRPGG